MEVILIAALHFKQPVVAEMSRFLNCADAQAIIGRIYEHKNLPDSQKRELAETVIDHMPINCPVPLQT
tara:strand:+ start:2098 stop:2301 length:204 start_codon:yes stop_codon:yes gene_type:complete